MALARWQPNYNIRRSDDFFDRFWPGFSAAPVIRQATV